MEEKVIRMIHDYHLSARTIYSSFNHKSILKISKIDSGAATAVLCKKVRACSWKYIRSLQASGIHPHYRSVNRRIIETMHRHGIKVRPYTVNHIPIIKQLASWNVDAIITDDARRAKKCLTKTEKNSAFRPL
ncbi:glycerophosphodiester phosphodiesterase family protein [Terrilactibacillus sp. S3-3]|nr:glycerophosphodiester phosphodiesterase family protein [Terrilactibacillus sp. S3-3]